MEIVRAITSATGQIQRWLAKRKAVNAWRKPRFVAIMATGSLEVRKNENLVSRGASPARQRFGKMDLDFAVRLPALQGPPRNSVKQSQDHN